ncbi:hypothetical protein EPO05_01185 [Patescibacteria group bacterium]|nr:MAG: hypothetical protein EPO05_01185 [Patescibacteria group bacterium]
MRMQKMAKRKILAWAMLLALSSNVFLVPMTAKADIWGSAYASQMMKQVLEEVVKAVEEAIRSSLKQAAAKAIKKVVYTIMGKSQDAVGGLFISSWEQALRYVPIKEARTYMDDYFKMMTRATSSLSNYVAYTGAAYGTSYTTDLVDSAMNATVGYTRPRPNLNEMVPDTANPTNTGDWTGLTVLVLNPANNQTGFNMMASEAYEKRLNELQEKHKAMAVAYQGFRPVLNKSGKVATPGSVIAEIEFGFQDLYNKILADAQSIPEVIAAAAGRLAAEAVEEGISNIEESFESKVDDVFDSNSSDYSKYKSDIDGMFGDVEREEKAQREREK